MEGIISEGLILWRLSMAGRSDLRGRAFELPDGLFFMVHDDCETPRPYTILERHDDIVSLVDRAEDLKRSLCKCGWAELDVE